MREDLTTLPEASRSWERHAEEYPLHHCGHLRSLRGVNVMVTGDLDEGRIGGFERQHAPEASAVIAWHRELALARAVPAQRSTRRPCGETSHSSQAARTGEQGRKSQRRRGKLRLGRDLHDPGPARPRDRARQIPRHQSGRHIFWD